MNQIELKSQTRSLHPEYQYVQSNGPQSFCDATAIIIIITIIIIIRDLENDDIISARLLDLIN